MAKDKGKSGGSGSGRGKASGDDRRTKASRAERGVSTGKEKDRKEEDWWNVPSRRGRVQPQVHVEGSGEAARRDRAQENKPPKGPAGGD